MSAGASRVTIGADELALVLHLPAGEGPWPCVVACHGMGASKDSDKYLLLGEELPRSSRGYFYQLAAVTGWTGVPFLPWLRQPALILAGDDDPIIPLANARLMHRLVRDSRLHVYPGGHLGLITEAATLAPVVDGFLAAP